MGRTSSARPPWRGRRWRRRRRAGHGARARPQCAGGRRRSRRRARGRDGCARTARRRRRACERGCADPRGSFEAYTPGGKIASMSRRRSVDESAADRAVLTALRARGGVATRADLVVDTALPEMVVERAVDRLLDEYVSSVGVAKGGALLYRFASGFPRRRERRAALRAVLSAGARAAGVVARGARTAFRIALALQLLIYTFVICLPVSVVVGVVVGIGIMIAGIFSDSGGDVLSLLTDPYGFVILVG